MINDDSIMRRAEHEFPCISQSHVLLFPASLSASLLSCSMYQSWCTKLMHKADVQNLHKTCTKHTLCTSLSNVQTYLTSVWINSSSGPRPKPKQRKQTLNAKRYGGEGRRSSAVNALHLPSFLPPPHIIQTNNSQHIVSFPFPLPPSPSSSSHW